MRKTSMAIALVLTCSALLGITVFREQVAHAAQAILPVKIMNTSAEPVPVLQAAPTRHAYADVVTGSEAVFVSAGVVLTDLVVASKDPDCTHATIGLFPNEHGAATLSLPLDGKAELHLQTGVLSTDESPLVIQVPFNCAATVFWSGYED